MSFEPERELEFRSIVHSSSRVTQSGATSVVLLILLLDTCGTASVDFPTAILPGILVYPSAVGIFCM